MTDFDPFNLKEAPVFGYSDRQFTKYVTALTHDIGFIDPIHTIRIAPEVEIVEDDYEDNF